MGLAPPGARLGDAIDAFYRVVLADGTPTYDEMLTAACQEPEDEKPLERIVRRTLLSMLEERQTRRPARRSEQAGQLGAGARASSDGWSARNV
jgi:hypothetical protein